MPRPGPEGLDRRQLQRSHDRGHRDDQGPIVVVIWARYFKIDPLLCRMIDFTCKNTELGCFC